MSSAYPISSLIEISGTGVAPGQIDFSDGTNVVEVKAPTTLTGTVNFTLPAADGTANQVLKWPSAGNTTVWGNNNGNPDSTLPLSFRFTTPNGDPTSTSSSTFQVVDTFVYNGTTIDNTITTAIAVVETSNTAATGQCQLFDLTNAQIIATSAIFGPTDAVKIILDLGTISNLPTGQAMLEVQIRRPSGGGGGNAAIHAFQAY